MILGCPSIYLVKRGPRPGYHRAPFHPVVIADRKRIAEEEAGWTGDEATVWEHQRTCASGGWLLLRWRGLDLDYGHVVRGYKLPDGSEAAFVHDNDKEPWTLLRAAVWWSDRRMPRWCADAGVIYPPDEWTRQRILDQVANDGAWNFREPPHWTASEVNQ